MLISLNGKIVSPEEATVSVLDHGFLYGDSIYEVVRTANGRLFAAEEHLERLRNSAASIRLQVPLTDDEFIQELERIHAASGHEESYIRIVVTRGVGEINLHPRSCDAPQWILITKPLAVWPEDYYTEGVKAALVDIHRNPDSALSPRIKSGNYLNNVIALMQAADAGAIEGLMLNPEGWLTEGTTSNIWIVSDGVLKTPATDCGLLPGITRALLIEIAKSDSIPLEETRISAGELLSAEEAFLSSTTRGVMPVRQIGEKEVGTGKVGPIARRLQELLEERLGAN